MSRFIYADQIKIIVFFSALSRSYCTSVKNQSWPFIEHYQRKTGRIPYAVNNLNLQTTQHFFLRQKHNKACL